jgi:Chalcone isomerase-like
MTRPLYRRRWLHMLGLVAALALPLAPGSAQAQVKVEGQTFDARARVANQDLALNGVGLRAVAWLKGYAAGLYLPSKATSADAVLAMPGPKRLQLRMLQEVSTQEFVKAFDRGVKRNTPEADLPALQVRMEQFDTAISSLGKVRKGDVVDLDFVPGQGLLFIHNGKRLGDPVKGEDFYAALLRIFIGPKPTDPELKAGLLGGPVS